jgi:hypothetical protein
MHVHHYPQGEEAEFYLERAATAGTWTMRDSIVRHVRQGRTQVYGPPLATVLVRERAKRRKRVERVKRNTRIGIRSFKLSTL